MKVKEYDAQITEIENSKKTPVQKAAALDKIWNEMGKAVWATTHETWAKEVRYRAGDLAYRLRGGK
jgi:hypothetical protein